MKAPSTYDHDVIVVGGGISGLGAALKLKEAGLDVLVLEKESQAGGRMSTHRIGDFAIDRGATIFGAGFHSMKRLVKKLQLHHLAEHFNFTFGLHDGSRLMKIRRARLDDVLFSNKVGIRPKLAMIRFGLSVLLNARKLGHGKSAGAAQLDDTSVEEYMQRLGGSELLDEILLPGLNGPMGGFLKKSSRLILFQTFWNILFKRTWAVKGGMDRIVNAMAKKLSIRTDTTVERIETKSENRAVVYAGGKVFTAKSVIIALPGNIAARLCPELPGHVLQLLRQTQYGKMVNAHVMLNKATNTTCAGYGICRDIGSGYEIELEHNRVKGLCPDGRGLASIYMWDEKDQCVTSMSDHEIRLRAEDIIRTRFPECANQIIGIHVIRWEEGIVHFPPGRLTRMAALRAEMKDWELPIQLCGDYLDGIASESALVTGEEAAGNVLAWVAKGRRQNGANFDSHSNAAVVAETAERPIHG